MFLGSPYASNHSIKDGFNLVPRKLSPSQWLFHKSHETPTCHWDTSHSLWGGFPPLLEISTVALSNKVIPRHRWLLSTWNVVNPNWHQLSNTQNEKGMKNTFLIFFFMTDHVLKCWHFTYVELKKIYFRKFNFTRSFFTFLNMSTRKRIVTSEIPVLFLPTELFSRVPLFRILLCAERPGTAVTILLSD